MPDVSFPGLTALAQHLRTELQTKKFVLLYAYNGTGKTRLSTEFKNLGKNGDDRDTLYFNAFTEDLFQWDNDLANDRERVLKINKDSHFFAGLGELEMDNRIRPLLDRYADFDFKIDTEEWEVTFSRNTTTGEGEDARTVTVADIKVSRGEENIFIWCFFLAIVQLAMDGAEAYKWVKFVYIDDPISSLDEHNAIAVANHLAQLLTKSKNAPRTVISSHHTLFFNVMGNELQKKAKKYLLRKAQGSQSYLLRDTGNTPFFQHVANLAELDQAQKSGKLYTHHFNMLRSILEKTASFHGYGSFSACIRPTGDDPEKTLYTRVVNIMSHGNYSLYEPIEMLEENKALFKTILDDFRKNFPFNPDVLKDATEEAEAE
jgi:wobble nucleotide-excising tRNase